METVRISISSTFLNNCSSYYIHTFSHKLDVCEPYSIISQFMAESDQGSDRLWLCPSTFLI